MTQQALAAIVSGLFLWAASFKMLEASSLNATIEQLGVSPRVAGVTARLIPIYEIVLGVLILGIGPALLASTLVCLAAVAIAAAGLVALRNRLTITCSCFSAHSSAQLGYRQVVIAPALVAAAVTLAISPPRSSFEESMIWLTAISIGAMLVHAISAVRDIRKLMVHRQAHAGVFPA